MIRIRAILLLAATGLTAWPARVSSALPQRLFVGTYTDSTSHGIYTLEFNPSDGTLSPPVLAAEAASPSFLAFDRGGTHLYAGNGLRGGISAYAVDSAGGGLSLLNQDIPAAEGMVSHLAVDSTGRMLIVAGNTSERGYVCTYPLEPDGRLGMRAAFLEQRGPPGPRHPRQLHPHAHSVTVSPDNRFALACDLGLDRIFLYRLDPARATIAPNSPRFAAVPPGSGPRHSKFSPDGRFFYVVNEMGGSVCVYSFEPDRGELSLRQTLSAIPSDFHGKNASAEIDISPDGRFMYVSNRGPDSLTVFVRDQSDGRLRTLERVSCGGKTPRHFTLSPDGRWLICANEDSNNIVVFRLDPATGRLAQGCGQATVPHPTCVIFYR